MVFCELHEHFIEDYGQRTIILPQKVFDILQIKESDVVKVIAKTKRIGVIAYLDSSKKLDEELSKKTVKLQGQSPSANNSANTNSKDAQKFDTAEDNLPRPHGLRYQGYPEIDNENIYPIRLDGEVRLSLGLNLGDRLEVDTVLEPENAEHIYISLIGKDPHLLSEEDRQLLFAELYKQNSRPFSSGLHIGIQIGFQEIPILIQASDPDGIVYITKQTIIEINDIFLPSYRGDSTRIRYDQIGGMKNIINQLRKLVEVPIRRPDIFKSINISLPKGILLSGPAGVGKTLLLNALVNESGAKVVDIPSNLFMGVGPTERNIRNLFQDVKNKSKNEPILLILENLDTLTPAQYYNQPEYERRFTLQFALGIDSLNNTNTIIIGTCNSLDNVSSMMRRAGRFDIEIEINVPTESERYEILLVHLRSVPLNNDVNEEVIQSFAQRMIGFVGADIKTLVKEAGMHSVSRFSKIFLNYTLIPPSVLRLIKVNREDFEDAFKIVEPSALRSIHSRFEKPNVRWSDVGGLYEVKRILKEQIEWQFKSPQTLKEIGIKPPHGLLLYGPPGNGKTLLAKAIATEIQANFISIKGPELLSVWFSESAKMIRELFNWARKLAPTIIFFDEIDAVVPRRGSENTDAGREIDATVNQLLTLLDGMENIQNIVVVGATNRPGMLDPALLRPGRFDQLVLVPSPDDEERREILKIHMAKIPIIEDRGLIIESLIPKTQGYSGADLENLCREAVLCSLRDNFDQRIVKSEHFFEANKTVHPSVNPDLIKYYAEFIAEVSSPKRFEVKRSKQHEYI